MKGICLQSLAVVFGCNSSQSARTPEVDCHREEQCEKCRKAGLDLYMVEEKTLECLKDDYDTGDKQQASFNKSRKILDLAVPVLVVGIGRFVGHTDGKQRHGCRDQVQGRMRRFRQNAQACGSDTDEDL